MYNETELNEIMNTLLCYHDYNSLTQALENAATAKKAEEEAKNRETRLNNTRKEFISALINYLTAIEPKIAEENETLDIQDLEEALKMVEETYASLKQLAPSIKLSELSADELTALIKTILG